MSFTQSAIDSDKSTTGVQTSLFETREKSSKQHAWTVLDDPSFRRLLRDGHCADTTVALLTQLENGA